MIEYASVSVIAPERVEKGLLVIGQIVEEAMRQHGKGKPLTIRGFTQLINDHWGDTYTKKSALGRLKNAGRTDRKQVSKRVDRYFLAQLAPFTSYTAEELWAIYQGRLDPESRNSVNIPSSKEENMPAIPNNEIVQLVNQFIESLPGKEQEFLRRSGISDTELQSLLRGERPDIRVLGRLAKIGVDNYSNLSSLQVSLWPIEEENAPPENGRSRQPNGANGKI